jgi:hypothetical protein
MEGVEAEFVRDIQSDQDAGGKPGSQTDKIDQGEPLLPDQVPEGEFEKVAPHIPNIRKACNICYTSLSFGTNRRHA